MLYDMFIFLLYVSIVYQQLSSVSVCISPKTFQGKQKHQRQSLIETYIESENSITGSFEPCQATAEPKRFLWAPAQ